MMDCIKAFRDVLQAAYGSLEWSPIADGTIHRFHVPGEEQGTCNGWYLLAPDRRPAGCFGSWRKSGMFSHGAGRLFGGA